MPQVKANRWIIQLNIYLVESPHNRTLSLTADSDVVDN